MARPYNIKNSRAAPVTEDGTPRVDAGSGSGDASGLPGGAPEDRPLTARSVIASILLPLDAAELPASTLVRSGGLFGISEGTCRVALSRMVASGELETVGGRYRLSGRLLGRQARQRQGRRPELKPWTGTWHLALVVPGRRSASARAALRSSLSGLRMAEWREGVWVRPDNLVSWPEAVARVAAVTARDCGWAHGTLKPSDGEPLVDLVERLWQPSRWAVVARRVGEELEQTRPALGRGDVAALAPGFRAAAAAVRHLTADPLLPPQLLPEGWPSGDLRARYDTYEQLYRRLLRRCLSDEIPMNEGA